MGPWFRGVVVVLRPPLMAVTKRDWQGAELIPKEGGIVLVTNHVSHFDPIAFGHFVYDAGRFPHFLAKSGVFKIPVLGRIIGKLEQIPVYRLSTDAPQAYRDAVAAVERGEAVIIYPEGTITRDPDLWPMAGKTGAARVALATGAPVIPIAQWGPQTVLSPYKKKFAVLPRKTMHMRVGPPVDL